MVLDGVSFFLCDRAKTDFLFSFMPYWFSVFFYLNFRKCIIKTFSIDYHLWKASPRSTLSLARARRRRISITAGWAAEGSEACGSKNDGKIVLEEGEHKEFLHSLLVFALFEDVMLSCCETAGYVRFALFTSGYGYSPPSATLAWDNFHLLNAKVQ